MFYYAALNSIPITLWNSLTQACHWTSLKVYKVLKIKFEESKIRKIVIKNSSIKEDSISIRYFSSFYRMEF
jgi:hypothetical protein